MNTFLAPGPDSPPRRRRLLALLALLASARLMACSTPVYQYALTNWPADAYDITVAADLPAEAALRERCTALLNGGDLPRANAVLRFLEDPARPAAEAHLTVRFPGRAAPHPPVWTGPFSETRLRWLLDSPLRARLTAELLGGAAAVFLFLPAGDPVADRAARARLQAALDELSHSPGLAPPPAADDPAVEAPPPAPYRFPVLEVPREDPAEGFLRAQLLASEADLEELREPLAFPVFGRGRLLYAIAGAGINRDVVADACVFLTGACSCEVKAQNPGIDLLLRADWDQAATLSEPTFAELPPLTGLDAAVASPPAATVPAAAVALPSPPARAPLSGTRFARRGLWLAAGAVIVVVAGTLVLLATRRAE